MSVNCNCGGCVSRGLICVAKGNSKRVTFVVSDQDGDPVDLSSAAEIELIVATGTVIGGQIQSGGTVLFDKNLTDGDIIIGGGGDSFTVDITPVDSVLPVNRLNYYEANVTTAAGEVYTVSAGIYQADATIVGGV